MKAERTKWEAKYQAHEYSHDGPPSGLLRRWIRSLPRGRALDVAAGLGRNAIFLARAGYTVDAIDISTTGLREARRRARRRGVLSHIKWIEADLDTYRFPRARYDLVINMFFLKRRLLGALKSSVRPGGVMILETHLQSRVDDGGPAGLRNRLRHGELRRRFHGWDVLDLEEGVFREGGRAWLLGRIVARRPAGRSSR